MKFKRASIVTKLIIILLIAAATVTLTSLQEQIAEKKQRAADLQKETAAAAQENQRMENAIEQADTEDGVKAIAREKLGMVDSDEIIFYDIGG